MINYGRTTMKTGLLKVDKVNGEEEVKKSMKAEEEGKAGEGRK